MPIRFCSKASTTSKQSDDVSVRKAEMESVNARVTKTKLEIEELKSQLQKLINDGMQKTDFTKTKENLAELHKSVIADGVTKPLETNQVDAIKAKIFKDSIGDIIENVSEANGGLLKITDMRVKPGNVTDRSEKVLKASKLESCRADSKANVQGAPQKIRHYDREAARKYIEKQRQKRKETMAQIKESRVQQDMTKQRLEELHQKSILLVTKSIKSKKKQLLHNQSSTQVAPVAFNQGSAQNLLAQERSVTNLKSNLLNDVEMRREIVPASQKRLSNFEFKNITVRPSQDNDFCAIQLKDLPKLERKNETENKAATKIQAVFRGYRQRNKFKLKRNLEGEPAKLYSTKQVQTTELDTSVPNWLQAQPVPSSYNFITAVKHKLNLAVQQSSYNNEATSFRSQHAQTSNQKESLSANGNLKSFLSHKCLSVDKKVIEPLQLASNVQSLKLKDKLNALQDDPNTQKPKNRLENDSDTSNNIPEISSEGTLSLLKNNKTQSSKRPLSDTDDKLPINTDRIKKLKLRSSQLLNENNDMKFSGRDSIIAYNKCDYVLSEPTEVNIASKSRSISNEANRVSSENLTQVTSEATHREVLASLKELSRESRSTEKPIETESQLTDKPQSEIKSESVEKQKSNAIESASKSVEKQKSSNESNGIETASNSRDKTESRIASDEVVSQPEYSSNFTSAISTSSLPAIKAPTMSLRSSLVSLDGSDNLEAVAVQDNVTNINLRLGEKTQIDTKIQSNEIHLKFEAELHLLNDFNHSLRQFMEVEKSLVDLRGSKNPTNNATTYYTRDTQTSIITKSSSDTKSASQQRMSEKHVPTVNYSRGSETTDHIDIFGTSFSNLGLNDTTLFATSVDLSHIKDSILTTSLEQSSSNINGSIKGDRNGKKEIPLEMFDQLILDEDIRIENLKTILKIREKALVDRTKGELAWLEVQKKNLRDSGQLQQISTIKKKQRGLLIKLEHERHEMQRLKQLQKAASKKRKLALTDKRNMIKAQLSANNVITKIKRSTREEKRHVGPLKVYNIKSHSESVKSETSQSRRSSITEVSVVSQSRSIVSHFTEEETKPEQNLVPAMFLKPQVETEDVKRSLLMREEALQKRRKAAEELLQWHQRLIDEEKEISELELAANAILNPTLPTDAKKRDEKYKFKGFQLNLLWKNMTGREENKFKDQLTYSMSKISLEQFCKDAKKLVNNRNKSLSKKSETNMYVDNLKENSVVNSSLNVTGLGRVETNRDLTDYTSDFDSTFSEEQSQSKTSEPDIKIQVTDDPTTDIIDEKSSPLENKLSYESQELNTEISSEYQTEIGSNENLLSSDDIKTEKRNSHVEVNTDKEQTAIISEYESDIGLKTVSPSSIRTEQEVSSKLNVGQEQSVILTEDATNDLVLPKASTQNEILADELVTNLDVGEDEQSDIVSENQTDYGISFKASQEEVITENNDSYLDIKTNQESSVIVSEPEINSEASNEDNSGKLKSDTKRSEISSEYESNHDASSQENSRSRIEIKTQGSESSLSKNKSLLSGNEIGTEIRNSSSELILDQSDTMVASELQSNDLSVKKQSGSEINTEVQESNSVDQIDQDKSEVVFEHQSNHDISSKYSSQAHDQGKLGNLEVDPEESTIASEYEIDEENKSKTGNSKSAESKNQSDSLTENQDGVKLPNLEIDKEESIIVSEYGNDQLGDIQSQPMSSKSVKISQQSNILSENETEVVSKEFEVISENQTSPEVLSKQHSEIISENPASPEVLSKQLLSLNNTEKEDELTSKGQNSQSFDSKKQTGAEDNLSEIQLLDKSFSANENLIENTDLTHHLSVDHNSATSKNDYSNIPTHKETSQTFQMGSGDGISIKSQKDIENLTLKSQIGSGDGIQPSPRNKESEILSEYDTENDVSEELLSEKLDMEDEKSDLDDREEVLDASVSQEKTNSQLVEEEKVSENEAKVLVGEMPKDVINESVIIPTQDVHQPETSTSDSKDSSLHDIESLEKSDLIDIGGDVSHAQKSDYNEIVKVALDTKDSKQSDTLNGKDNKQTTADELDNIYPVHKNNFETEISSEEITKSEESFLQLSYGYIEKKPEKSQDFSTSSEESLHENASPISSSRKGLEDKSEDNKPPVLHVDVKRRVSEIMADANIASPRGDRSPRMQDLYVTAYDVISPEHSPEPASPVDDVEPNFSSPKRVYENDEVEELLKKQLAIEQEIKEIQQQQKEHLPYLYVREIPNKPPPPYKPPVICQVPTSDTILPCSDNYICVITSMASDVLYDAYLNNMLETVTLSDEQKSLLQTKHKIDESCVEFVFDLCREAALLHHKQFEHKAGPSWMYLTKRSSLAISKSLDKVSMGKFIDKSVKQWLGYETTKIVENAQHKWSSKKRDHVDELLVAECQAEESEWTNYENDELIVKDELTKNIMDMLIEESAKLFNDILNKNKSSLF